MYQLYSKLDRTDKRAPGKISLERDYELTGEVEAVSRSEAVRKWFQGEDYSGGKIASPEVGDVLGDPTGSYFILTPQTLWASVSLLEG